MKIISSLCAGLLFTLLSGITLAQSGVQAPQKPEVITQPADPAAPPCPETASTIDVLTDMQGANFGPFVRRMMMGVRENWYRLIPESDLAKTGCLTITFSAQKDGHVADMKLVSSSGDESLDRAASKAIEASDPFPAFPSGFSGDHLLLRFHFVYNPNLHLSAARNTRVPPTVISSNEEGPIYAIGHGVTPPKGIYTPAAEYSDKARRKKIQGTVVLQIVVTAQGTVRDAKVTASLEPSLDRQAILSVESWKFQPAMKDGAPVAVQVASQMTFKLY